MTAEPDGQTCSAIPPSLSCTVTDLANDSPYTFTVIAINSEGESESSEPSDPITPIAAPEPTPEPIPEPTPESTPEQEE